MLFRGNTYYGFSALISIVWLDRLQRHLSHWYLSHWWNIAEPEMKQPVCSLVINSQGVYSVVLSVVIGLNADALLVLLIFMLFIMSIIGLNIAEN